MNLVVPNCAFSRTYNWPTNRKVLDLSYEVTFEFPVPLGQVHFQLSYVYLPIVFSDSSFYYIFYDKRSPHSREYRFTKQEFQSSVIYFYLYIFISISQVSKKLCYFIKKFVIVMQIKFYFLN